MNYSKNVDFFQKNKYLLFGFGILIYLFWNKLEHLIKSVSNNVTPNDVEKAQKGQITNAYAKQLANQLLVAMDRLGTDEKSIHSVYQKLYKYPREVHKVWNAFGIHKYFWGTHAGFIGENKNLYGWLVSELSSSHPVFKEWKQLLEKAGLI